MTTVSPADVLAAAEGVSGWTRASICEGRTLAVRRLRHVVCAVAREHGCTYVEIAREMGCSAHGVEYACHAHTGRVRHGDESAVRWRDAVMAALPSAGPAPDEVRAAAPPPPPRRAPSWYREADRIVCGSDGRWHLLCGGAR